MVEMQASMRALQSTPQLASEDVIPASQPVLETPRSTQVQETGPGGLRTARDAAPSPVAPPQGTPVASVTSQRGRGASTRGRPRKLGPHEQLLRFD